MKYSRILITGGAGFVGSSLSLALLNKGYEVTVLDNLSEQIHGKDAKACSSLFLSIKDKVNFIKGSVADYAIFQTAVRGQQAIIHLAAETGTGQSMYQISQYSHVNMQGTANLLDILANDRHEVEKVVVASSRAIYGEGKYVNGGGDYFYPGHRLDIRLSRGDFELYNEETQEQLYPVATDESALIHPSSVYGITKQYQEQMVMTICPTLGIKPVAFRYQNVYGPGQSLNNPYTGILSIFSNLIRNQQTINIFEDGQESRDFVYVDDVVEATILGLEREEANNQVYNVGTGQRTTVLAVAKMLMANYGTEVPLNISGNYRMGDIRHNFADITKLKEQLGFSPCVSFSDGLQHFTDWVKDQRLLDQSQYEYSLNVMREKHMFK
ncbi:MULTISPECIES: NAD-dependent epimerase/dehydratase family protein [Olivibacter]|uniref:NAD-dependent epimerase/dehydratase family protein n=1 Tax=Olivibacter jilunii TaxID=985016 RepID=A0ABW6BBW2_9SPHI|nr:NAD-dependent epimerase/dehydratase family protein [Olivibacter sp. UJ_SKK_5.1]MDX3912642.1 NAD-dependent epimerase/dehydratase family protein [Pseudosphingobacterium sp.]